jgi:hypothetical protein
MIILQYTDAFKVDRKALSRLQKTWVTFSYFELVRAVYAFQSLNAICEGMAGVDDSRFCMCSAS